MSTSLLRTLAFCAIAAVTAGFASTASATTLAGVGGARVNAASQTDALVIPAARRSYHGYQSHRGYHGYQGYRGYRGYYGYRGYRGYRGYYGYRRPYYGYRGYWGPTVYIDPYYDYYSDVPRYYSAPRAKASCAYWHRQCVRNWGNGNSNYRGCMRYQGCAAR